MDEKGCGKGWKEREKGRERRKGGEVGRRGMERGRYMVHKQILQMIEDKNTYLVLEVTGQHRFHLRLSMIQYLD